MPSAIRIITFFSRLLDVNFINLADKQAPIYDAATQKWVNRDIITLILPDQTNNGGKFLQTDGVTLSWQDAGGGNSGYSGISGYSGKSGYSGYSGISGYSGSGISGYSGSGISGYSGVSGLGISGYSGFSGYSGISGTSGYSGKSGYSGVSGFSGYSGVFGFSGYSGISGYSGVGTSGFSGYSGMDGTASASGYSGTSGYSGKSGYSGISGYSGYSGISGYSGSGVSGYSGVSGLGISGYSGTSGFSGYSGGGSVSSVSVTANNGITRTVTNPTTNVSITLGLGDITPTTVNALTLTAQTNGFTIDGGTTSKKLTVPLDATVSGTNTGDQTITLTTDVTTSAMTSGSYAATIANNAVTLAKMAQVTPSLNSIGVFLGRLETSGAGNVQVLRFVDITGLGTIQTGTWNATTISVLKGGTGLTSIGTANQVLGVNSGASALEYKTVSAGSSKISVTHAANSIAIDAVEANFTLSNFGGVVPVTKGGTNLTVTAGAGSIWYGTSTTSVASLAAGTSTQVLHGGSTPSWASINLASAEVSGILAGGNGGTNNAFTQITGPTTSIKTFTLPNATCTILTTNAVVTVPQGGTGAASFSANNVLLGNGTSAFQVVAPSTSGNILTSNGTTWISSAPVGASISIGSTITSGTTGSVLFIGSGPILSQNNANFFWDNTNNANFLRLGAGTSPGEIRLLEGSGGGSNYFSFKASSSMTSNTSYILPNAYPASTLVLASDASGNMSWISPGGSVSFADITSGVNSLGNALVVETSSYMEFWPQTLQFVYNSTYTHKLESGTTSASPTYLQKFSVGNQCLQIANGRYTINQITANQPAWDIGLSENFIKIWSDTGSPPRQLQGIDGQYAGRLIYICNGGDYDIRICNDSASASTNAQRISTPYFVDMILRPRDVFCFLYDDEAGFDSAGRWRLIGGYSGVIEDPIYTSKQYEEFWGGTNTSGSLGNSGFTTTVGGVTGAISTSPSTTAEELGWIQLQTGTTNVGRAAVRYQLPNLLMGGTIWECLLRIPNLPSIPNDTFYILAGMADQDTTQIPTNFIGFVLDPTTSTNWKFRTTAAGVSTETESFTPYDTNWMHLKWILSSDKSSITLSINGSFFQTFATDSTLPTVRLYPVMVGIFGSTRNSVTRVLDLEMTKIMVVHTKKRLVTPAAFGIEKGGTSRPQYPSANGPAGYVGSA